MTAALEGGEWSEARPGRTLPPGKTRYPFYTRLGGPQGRSGRAENIVPTGIRSRTVQPVVSPYTEWATLNKYGKDKNTTQTMERECTWVGGRGTNVNFGVETSGLWISNEIIKGTRYL